MMVVAALCSLVAGGLIPVYCYYVGKANSFIAELKSGADQ